MTSTGTLMADTERLATIAGMTNAVSPQGSRLRAAVTAVDHRLLRAVEEDRLEGGRGLAHVGVPGAGRPAQRAGRPSRTRRGLAELDRRERQVRVRDAHDDQGIDVLEGVRLEVGDESTHRVAGERNFLEADGLCRPRRRTCRCEATARPGER